jgi:hypothetical protein
MAQAGRQKRPVIAPRTAYLTGTLLRRVVAQGHSKPIRDAALSRCRQDGNLEPDFGRLVRGLHLALAYLGVGRETTRMSDSLAMPTPASRSACRCGPVTCTTPTATPHSARCQRGPPASSPSIAVGPLIAGFPPPPSVGLSPEGRPYELPENLRDLPTAPKGSRPPKIF